MNRATTQRAHGASPRVHSTSGRAKCRLVSWILLAVVSGGTQPGWAQSLEILRLTGDASSSGTIDALGRPSAASPGTVIYPASIDTGSFDQPDAILRYRAGTTTEIAIETQVVDGSYELYSFYGANQTLPSTNALGDVLFNAEFLPVGGSTDDGIFLFDDDTGMIKPVVRDGDAAVDGNGFLDVALTNHPALADDGQVAFWASIYGAVGGLGNGSGIYRWLNGNLTRIVRSGQPEPGGGSFFDGFSWPSLNRVGDVAFVGLLDSGGEGVYRGDGGPLVEIARTGDESPPGWLITDFTPVAGVAVNDAGQVAMRAYVDPPGCCGLANVIYLGSGGALTMPVFGGQALPGGGTVPAAINRNLALNNRGQVVFMSPQNNSASGIFRVDAGGDLLKIALGDETVPGSSTQTFVWISGYDFALNEQGDVAFVARFDNGSEFVDGLFLYTDTTGLIRVVEPGTPLAGSTVQDFSFVGTNTSDWRSGEPSGLDDQGHVVFRFRLVDNRRGIAIFRNPAVFGDGFESGDLSRWSYSVP